MVGNGTGQRDPRSGRCARRCSHSAWGGSLELILAACEAPAPRLRPESEADREHGARPREGVGPPRWVRLRARVRTPGRRGGSRAGRDSGDGRPRPFDRWRRRTRTPCVSWRVACTYTARTSRWNHPSSPHLPPVMVWLGQLAHLQRACLALCVFGGLTHREAADLLDVPPSTVAELLTAGLRELGQLAAGGAATSA